MATYQANPFAGGQDPRIARSLASLAEVLVPNQNKLLEQEIAQAEARAGIMRDYSGVQANEALAAERFAGRDKTLAELEEQRITNRALSAFGDLFNGYQPGMDPDGFMRSVLPQAMLGGIDVDPLVTFGALYGQDRAGTDRFRPYGETVAGEQWKTIYEDQNELVEGFDSQGNAVFVPKSRIGAADIRPMVSETDAKGFAFQGLSPAEQRLGALADVPVETIIGPQGVPELAFRPDAVGGVPVPDAAMGDFLENMAAGADGTGGPGIPQIEGTGLDAQLLNFAISMGNKIDQGIPLTPDEQRTYSYALSILSKGSTSMREGPDGVLRQVYEQGGDLSMFPSTTPLPGAAPSAAPAVSAAPPAPAPTPAGPQLTVPGMAPPPAATRTQMPSPLRAPGVEVMPVEGFGKPPLKPRTEAQGRMFQFSERIGENVPKLIEALGFDPATGGFRPDAWELTVPQQAVLMHFTGSQGAGTALMNPLLKLASGLDDAEFEKAATYWSVAQGALNPLIRADSGAAVPVTEYPQYYSQYIPLAGEPEAQKRAKMENLIVTQTAFADLSSNDPEFMRLIAAGDAAAAAGRQQEADALFAQARSKLHAQKAQIKQNAGWMTDVFYGGPPAAPAAPGAAAPRSPMKVGLPGGVTATEIIE